MRNKEKMITNKELREMRLLDDRMEYLQQKLSLFHQAIRLPFDEFYVSWNSSALFETRKQELDLIFSDVVSADKFLEALQKLAAESD